MQYPVIEKIFHDEIAPRLLVDQALIRDFVFGGKEPAPEGSRAKYLATAGAPLSGKSTILNNFLTDNKKIFGNGARIDPDVWCLAFMDNAFHDYMMDLDRWNITDEDAFKEQQKMAYNVLRPASNYMTLEMMNQAFLHRYDIVHGTTSTGGTVERICQQMHLVGREIHFILCAAPDEEREEARKHREDVEKFYQVTPEDVIDKGKLFPQRMGVYFKHGDVIDIMWQSKACTDSVCAARFDNGKLEIIDQDAYNTFIDNYHKQAAELKEESNIDLPRFETHVENYQNRFRSPAGIISMTR